jgi:hypothetical protein
VSHILISAYESVKSYLDNREIAILIWLGVLIIWALSQKRIRKSIKPLLRSFTQKKIFISTTLMLLYITAIIYFFSQINFWDVSLLFDTIIWIIGVAFATYININHIRDEGFLRKVIFDNIKFAVIVEFVTNLYVFDLFIELILVPIMVFLILALGVTSTKSEFKKVETILTIIIGIFGIGFIIFTAYNVIFDFRGFASIENLKELFMPLIFTITLLPFIYILALYITYDMIFMRIQHLIKNPSLVRYAKWRTVFSFHINLRKLNSWMSRIAFAKLDSKEEIDISIKSAKRCDT